jgi:hypothetical protein
MSVTFDQRLRVPAHVVVSDLDGEAVILNTRSHASFSLNPVGARMLAVVTVAESVQVAYNTLLHEFDVDPGQLRVDFHEILSNLVKNGLLDAESL